MPLRLIITLKEKLQLTIQNKMHYAVSNNTAAEIVYNRVDSNKENIGLTNFKGDMPTRKKQKLLKII